MTWTEPGRKNEARGRVLTVMSTSLLLFFLTVLKQASEYAYTAGCYTNDSNISSQIYTIELWLCLVPHKSSTRDWLFETRLA